MRGSGWYRRLRAALVRRRTLEVGPVRKVRISEDYPSDRFLVIVALMIVFFVGLSLLEVIHISKDRPTKNTIISATITRNLSLG